jgi:hypothetical protein
LYIKTDNKLYIKNSSGTEGAVTSDLVGATSSTAGTAGLVPAPSSGQNELGLKGDATFGETTLPQRVFPSQRFCNDAFSGGDGTTGFNSFRTHFNLIWVPRRMSFDRIGVVQNTAGLTHNMRLGVYNSDSSTGLPSTVNFDAGEVTLNGAGTYTITINQTLDAGYYYGAIFTGSSGINCTRFTSSYVLGYLRGKTSNSSSASGAFPFLEGVPANASTAFGNNPTISGEDKQAPVVFLRKT